MWIFLIMGVIFIAIGFGVHRLKWHFLISGYNTMSREKKARVDIERLSRLMAIYSYLNGIIYIGSGGLGILGFDFAIIPAVIFTMVSTIYLLIKSQKYDGNIYDKDGKRIKGSSKESIFGIVVLVLSLIFVVAIMYRSSQPTDVTLMEEGLEIHGMYGDVYSWDSIEEVVLLEDLPTIRMRTNGSAVGSHLKGNFTTEEMGPVRLHVNTKHPPFIHIETSRRTIILNMPDPDDTQRILDEILLRLE